MKVWYLVVRKEEAPQVCYDGLPGEYPKEGFGIIAYDDKERAELYCKNCGPNYEVIEVIKNGC